MIGCIFVRIDIIVDGKNEMKCSFIITPGYDTPVPRLFYIDLYPTLSANNDCQMETAYSHKFFFLNNIKEFLRNFLLEVEF